jgi:pimeloyl-ACP methyl ester carboxylesterase
MGGAIALLLGEKYPDVYSGVLDLAGPKDYKEHYAHKESWANLSEAELTEELTALGAGVPPYMYSSLESYQESLVTGNLDIELETGGTPATHPAAYENISPTYHANITIPVITIHGTSDAMVLFSQSITYQAAVANAGRSDLYRLYNVTGGEHMHSSVMAEVPARFDELVEWAEIIPEGLSIEVMLLLSTIATIVGISILRKRPKRKRW